MIVRDLDQAHELCRRITEKFGPNFSVGFRFLPVAKRKAVYAAYAFCRYADDVADRHLGDGSPLVILDAWENELERVYRGESGHPIGRALADVLEAFPIPQEAFGGLIEGCRHDLEGRRYRRFEDLKDYCELVAATIGQICLSIFGVHHQQAHGWGRSLSLALQMTNILRDVGEDARNGRLYLPEEELAEFSVREDALARGESSAGFLRLMDRNIDRARRLYAEAEPVTGAVDADARMATRLMGGVYVEILRKIAADPVAVLTTKVGLSSREKAWIVARHMMGRPVSWAT